MKGGKPIGEMKVTRMKAFLAGNAGRAELRGCIEFELEWKDPKGDELCLVRLRRRESVVEGHKDFDVQINPEN